MKVIILIVKIINLLEFMLLMKIFSSSGSLEYIYMFFFNPLYSWEWVQIENMIEMESTRGELKENKQWKEKQKFSKKVVLLKFLKTENNERKWTCVEHNAHKIHEEDGIHLT